MSDQPANSDLTLATSEELVTELRRRTECMVLAFVIQSGSDAEQIRLRFSGLRLLCRGLLADLTDYARVPAHFEDDEETEGETDA